MVKFVFLIISFFLICLIGKPVLASPGHDHNQTLMKTPFHKKGQKQPLHCILRGHSQKDPCPHVRHYSQSGNSSECFLSRECGDSSGNTVPNLQKVSKSSTILSNSFDFPTLRGGILKPFLFFQSFAYPPLSPPPKSS